jgi:hypothetical protein
MLRAELLRTSAVIARLRMAGAVMDLLVSTDAPPGSLLDALAVASGRPATELTTTSPPESGGQRDELRASGHPDHGRGSPGALSHHQAQ